ncbi:Lsr2-like DNA bridging protein [Microbacterium phage Pumpernickel]|uniref:Lsr2-like DNA bridging protein n=1 Tax=Microbacterium phage Pumpernickel TaxID=2885983 RepID=A0AAE8YA69_9CAUD|nr:Lsr2-like DNA bridging protein [Microbacterium phage Pumpernickel]YP_010755317.1 Lsr2-like DNA bridging protein [Microbacterium phage Pumpernickel]UDL15817.1 Lsr2-like DNA bridging protein [Microbacterium phage Pumpernickel]UDL16077.1 Lsr2-like DNA bridging protein [Microbacterium phage Pumpernickel]
MRVNITISLPEGATQADAQKAVRRALEGSSTILEPNTSVKVKGVRVSTKGGNVNDVRKWARQNGIEVGARGRVSAEVVAAFEAAQAKPAKRK